MLGDKEIKNLARDMVNTCRVAHIVDCTSGKCKHKKRCAKLPNIPERYNSIKELADELRRAGI